VLHTNDGSEPAFRALALAIDIASRMARLIRSRADRIVQMSACPFWSSSDAA